MSSGLTCALSRGLSAAASHAFSVDVIAEFRAASNRAVLMPVPGPAAALVPNSSEHRVIPAGVPYAISHLSGKAAASLPQSKDSAAIYM